MLYNIISSSTRPSDDLYYNYDYSIILSNSASRLIMFPRFGSRDSECQLQP